MVWITNTKISILAFLNLKSRLDELVSLGTPQKYCWLSKAPNLSHDLSRDYESSPKLAILSNGNNFAH